MDLFGRCKRTPEDAFQAFAIHFRDVGDFPGSNRAHGPSVHPALASSRKFALLCSTSILLLMGEVTSANFGLLIAYLTPGLTVLWGMSRFSPVLRHWLAMTSPDAPTVGGFLYLSIAAIIAGVSVSAVRWAIIDTLHHATGVAQPTWNFRNLENQADAFHLLIDIHYRYYQFYANMLIALVFWLACRRIPGEGMPPFAWLDLVALGLTTVFYAASRDALWKYYRRGEQLLSAGLHDRRFR
jgi:hypothetical protein